MIDVSMKNSPFGIGDHVTEPAEPTLEEVGQAPLAEEPFIPETGDSDSVEIAEDDTQGIVEEGEEDE